MLSKNMSQEGIKGIESNLFLLSGIFRNVQTLCSNNLSEQNLYLDPFLVIEFIRLMAEKKLWA